MNNTTNIPASNSEVLKRFGPRMIMWRAHGIFKIGQRGVVTLGDALKATWKSFRSQIDRERAAAARRAENTIRFGGVKLDPGFGRGSYAYQTTVMGA